MSQSNYERCVAWIANKPKVDDIRSKLAIVEEKLLSLSDAHPKRDDLQATMHALLERLEEVDDSVQRGSYTNSIAKVAMDSSLSSDADPDIHCITDPHQKRLAFELLKNKLGSGIDLLNNKQLVA